MSNKTIVLTVLPVLILAVLSGCVGQKTITTPAGKVTVEEGGVGPSWCKAGTKMTMTQTIPGSQGPSSFEIKGLTTHNGTEVCEADYNYDQGAMTYYFNQKGDYIVMDYKDKNGNVIQEMNIGNITNPTNPTNPNP